MTSLLEFLPAIPLFLAAVLLGAVFLVFLIVLLAALFGGVLRALRFIFSAKRRHLEGIQE